MNCPYCGEEKKPRGLKNHCRMASGNGHGEAGAVPETYESDLEAANSEGNESDGEAGQSDGEAVETEPETVTTDDLQAAKEGRENESDGNEGNGSEYPFDPDDPDAIALDGGETVDIRKDGEIYPGVEAQEGDYLLKTDKGPVLYDDSEGELYEVVTA